MITTINNAVGVRAHKITAQQPMGVQIAELEVSVFGIPETIRVYNAKERNVQDLAKCFRSLECSMSVVVSAYLYTFIQECYTLSDSLKMNNLMRFFVKKEMGRVYSWIDDYFTFSRRNQGERNTAWETVMSEMNGKVWGDLKLLRLLNRRYAISHPERIKIDADCAAQLMMVSELGLLCRTKFGKEVETFQQENKISFDPRIYGRHFDCTPACKCLDRILVLLTGSQTVLEDPDIATQLKIIIRKLDNLDNLNEAAGIAVEENEGGVFDNFKE